MGQLALHLAEARSAAQHPVEFVHHVVNRFIKVVGGSTGKVILATNFELPLGHELVLVGGIVRVIFKLDPHTNNLFFVLEEFFRLLMNHVFNRIGQIHVVTGYDDVMLLHMYLLSIIGSV